MDIGVISKRYAKALLEYAVESKSEDIVYDEVLNLIDNFRKLPQLAKAVENPLLPPAELESVLCAAAADKASPVFQKFVNLVVAHHREKYMVFIAHSFVTLYRELKHISIGHLITAQPASPEVEQRMKKMVAHYAAQSTQLILDEKVDNKLLGGFIFEIDNMRLDASIASQFERIKKQFIEKNKRII